MLSFVLMKAIYFSLVFINSVVTQEEVPYWTQMRNLMARQESTRIDDQNVEQLDIPWQVSLTTNDEHFCSGALIGPRAVLTAALCVLIVGPNIVVKYGGSDRTNLAFSNAVSKVIYAPNFKENYPDGNYDDVVILRLKDQVIESDLVKFILIDEQLPIVGSSAQHTGWGYTGSDLNTKPRQLQMISMAIISREHCNEMTSSSIGPNYMCARNAELSALSACNADSGGPLVINQKLVGVVSGTRICSLGSPVVLISTFAVSQWIISNTKYLKRRIQRIEVGQNS